MMDEKLLNWNEAEKEGRWEELFRASQRMLSGASKQTQNILDCHRAELAAEQAAHAETRKLANEAIENVMRCVCTTAYTNHEHFTKWCNENHSSGDIRKAMGWV